MYKIEYCIITGCRYVNLLLIFKYLYFIQNICRNSSKYLQLKKNPWWIVYQMKNNLINKNIDLKMNSKILNIKMLIVFKVTYLAKVLC